MPMALVPQVEVDDISRQKAPHALRERPSARPHQQVEVIGHERPGIYNQGPSPTEFFDTVEEILPVRLVAEDLGSFNTPAYDMVQGARGIESRVSRHAQSLHPPPVIVKFIQKQRPLF